MAGAARASGSAGGWGAGDAAGQLRFVVPDRTLYARPNPKYLGRKRGITWLNMINDQAAGLSAKVLFRTPRDSLHAVDVVLRQQGGWCRRGSSPTPARIRASCSGCCTCWARQYQPQLANLPDQRLWRIDPAADYGPGAGVRGKKGEVTRT